MTTKISVSLAAIDEDFLRQLKSKHTRHTRLDIQVVELDEEPVLTEANFWAIIAQLDWTAESREAVLYPAVQALARQPLSHIYQFEDMLAEKLHALDTAAHATTAYPEPRRVSEDGFLYVRAAVIARGQAHYDTVLHNPAALPADEDFEPLLSLAALAYTRKTGKSFDYVSPLSYETYANETGWEV
jgi:Protein of unknown function (DUF4240)